MNPITPTAANALNTLAGDVSQMTLGQWLAQFETIATPAQIQQVAGALERTLGGNVSEAKDAAASADFLRALATGASSDLADHLDTPVTRFLPLAESRLTTPDEALTWAGRRSSSLLGYAARTAVDRVFSAMTFRTPSADRYYDFSEQRMARALERYEYVAYEARPDPVERREAFSAEHGRRLRWAADHATSLLKLVTPKTREFYEECRSRVVEINRQYRELLDRHDRLLAETDHLAPHDQNVRISDGELEINAKIDVLEKSLYEIEKEWQSRFYEGVMETARAFVQKPSPRHEAEFEKALRMFQAKAQAELDYRDLLLQNDKDATPNKRKNLEEAAYRSLMHDSETLHDTVRSILRAIGHPGAEDLTAPLSFVWKNQAYRHSQGPVDLVSAERLIESMIPHDEIIAAGKKSAEGLAVLDDFAGRVWATPALADYFDTFRLGAPAGLLSLSDQAPPEVLQIRGALAVFGSNSNPLREMHFNEFSPGVISDQTHGDTMDYMAILASRYLFWGRSRWKPSIVAESIFKWIPYMGRYLQATTGGFLSRSDKAKREHFLNVTSRNLLAKGRDEAQFGEGTRRLTNPFAARYSDLSHPGAPHNPAEFLIPGNMRGMQFRLALANKADVHVYAAKIHGGGSGEPSIPRSVKGFITPNYTEFSYRPPMPENGFVAWAGVIRYRDMIKPEDFPGEPMHQILGRNVAVNRRMLRRTGLNMDAGPRVK